MKGGARAMTDFVSDQFNGSPYWSEVAITLGALVLLIIVLANFGLILRTLVYGTVFLVGWVLLGLVTAVVVALVQYGPGGISGDRYADLARRIILFPLV